MSQKIAAGISPVLYHWTPLLSALSILEGDRFNLACPERSGDREGYYYLSATRSKLGGYHVNRRGVIFVLDGTALGRKHKGEAVDFWSNEEWRRPDKDTYEGDEMEDRILSKKPHIEHASKYIKEIHVCLSTNNVFTNDHYLGNVRKFIALAKRYSIPIYVYAFSDMLAWLHQDKRKTVPLEKFEVTQVKEADAAAPTKKDIKKIIAYHGSNTKILTFNPKLSAQEILWFSTDKKKIENGESGASGTKYIHKVELSVKNPAGWDEYEKLGLGQITDRGFDSINLDEDWVIFDPKNIKLLEITPNPAKVKSQVSGKKVALTLDSITRKYPVVKNIGEIEVTKNVPNTASIAASLNDYEVVKGIREVPISEFGDANRAFYAANDWERSEKLALAIRKNKYIDPLIVVIDDEGLYILEGAHRWVALAKLKVKSIPAVIVIDLEKISLNEDKKTDACFTKIAQRKSEVSMRFARTNLIKALHKLVAETTYYHGASKELEKGFLKPSVEKWRAFDGKMISNPFWLTPSLTFAKLHGKFVYRIKLHLPKSKIFGETPLIGEGKYYYDMVVGDGKLLYDALEEGQLFAGAGDFERVFNSILAEDYDVIETGEFVNWAKENGFGAAYVQGDGERNLMVFNPEKVEILGEV